MPSQPVDSESFSLLAVDDDEFDELDRLLADHPTIHLQDLVVDDPTGRLLDRYPPHPPGAAVWNRIEREIAQEPASADRPLESARSMQMRGRRRWAVIAGTVAASVLAVVAAAALLQSQDLTSREPFAAEAFALLAAGDATVLKLTDPNSESNAASIIMGEDGTAFFIFGGLEALSPDRTYQLWAVVDGEVVSAALLGADGGTRPIRLEANPEVLAVTIESAGGVAVSEEEPVAVWAAGA